MDFIQIENFKTNKQQQEQHQQQQQQQYYHYHQQQQPRDHFQIQPTLEELQSRFQLLNDQRKQTIFCDVTIRCGTTSFPAHR